MGDWLDFVVFWTDIYWPQILGVSVLATWYRLTKGVAVLMVRAIRLSD